MKLKYLVELVVAMVMVGVVSSMSVPVGSNDPLSIKDTLGHFPGVDSNTFYPGMLPPGYTYTRRVRTRMPNQLYYPPMPSYAYRKRTTYNNAGFPWMWYALSEM